MAGDEWSVNDHSARWDKATEFKVMTTLQINFIFKHVGNNVQHKTG